MIRIFKNLTKKELLFSAVALGFIVVQVWLELTIPDYMNEITMLVRTPGSVMSDIWLAGGKMLACALGSLASSVVVAICASEVAAGFSWTLRRRIFSKVGSFSMEEMNAFSTASLITRSTNDITQVQMLIVLGLQAIAKAPIMATWAIIKISNKSWQWTFSTGVAVLVMLVVVLICLLLAVPKFKRIQKLTDNVNKVTRENLTGLSVVRAYNAEAYQEGKFDRANEELAATHLYTGRVMSFMGPSIQLISSGLMLAIYWIGATLIQNSAEMASKATIFADMVVFSSYAMQIVMSFMMLVMIFMILPRASVSATRILEVLDTSCAVKDGNRASGDTELSGEVEFKNVCFSYPDAEERVLDGISFSAHKGETVAIIGSTGCGKSTVINLIPRFYDVTEGELLVDGVNVRDYTQYDLRNKIGYVSQRATLFTGTIASNVLYGENGNDNRTQDDVEASVRTAQAEEFVAELPEKYDGFVAQGGSNYSGGQKQRISIARAICRKPEIFIFDDSFSALDYKTDRELREALRKECADSTKIIVAQRIGTIRDADRIIVLESGKIAGIGTHDELMKNCDVYRQIAFSQLSEEELA